MISKVIKKISEESKTRGKAIKSKFGVLLEAISTLD